MTYKVVLTFHLAEGMADEELRRSEEPGSFPNMLAQQHGCIDITLVKVDDGKTMSIQTWEKQADWWAALKVVQDIREKSATPDNASILVSRDFVAGEVKRVIPASAA